VLPLSKEELAEGISRKRRSSRGQRSAGPGLRIFIADPLADCILRTKSYFTDEAPGELNVLCAVPRANRVVRIDTAGRPAERGLRINRADWAGEIFAFGSEPPRSIVKGTYGGIGGARFSSGVAPIMAT
jgi:hypothetical protein